MISASQIRAARALLGWSGQQLADRCSISLKTLRRYEGQSGVPSGSTRVMLLLKSTLEKEGVRFLGDPMVNPGVELEIKS